MPSELPRVGQRVKATTVSEGTVRWSGPVYSELQLAGGAVRSVYHQGTTYEIVPDPIRVGDTVTMGDVRNELLQKGTILRDPVSGAPARVGRALAAYYSLDDSAPLEVLWVPPQTEDPNE